ncbi:uncharacterized protein LOC115923526 [Strongylocentrotus purpuratus]|uniref:B box-type domain-containing protein n=1 Tax=Strongylocentrotus purpuratus TaxID=7668 RepID=A0A7M7SYC0_STRPU|nr:uncharacterized protein LOC115923526 [Strongylocentrotus purpuratus]
MDSIAKPVLYVHSSVRCDICGRHPARHYCRHDACKEHIYICDNCISAHNTYNAQHGDFLQCVVVSEVKSKCCEPGHSERLADHICVPCQKPLCDDCRDDHHDRGHDFNEIQSAVAATKIKISKSLDQLKEQVKHKQEMCANALDLVARDTDKLDVLSKEVKTNINDVWRLIKDHESKVLHELEDERHQLLKDLWSSITPIQDQTAASSEVIFDAQELIICRLFSDSSVFFSHRNPQTLLQTVNSELTNATLWIHANKLSLNLKKTNYMLFSNWKYHISKLCKLLSRNTGVIYKLKSVSPLNILRMLYATLILPYLHYGVLAWGNSFKSQMDKLLLVQKRVIRIVCNTHYLAHTDVLFCNSGVLKAEDIYHLQLGALMYELNAGLLPVALAGIFKKNNQVHNYSTRQAQAYHLPLVRTQFALTTLGSTGPRFWNSLEPRIAQSVSIYVFKRKLKLLYLSRYHLDL